MVTKTIQNSKVKMQNYNAKFKSDLKTRCYHFSLSLIAFIDSLPNQRSCWIIADQLLRSGMSIGANLVEATSSSSRLEFKKFHEIALKSANETKYWFGLLRDSGKGDKEKVAKLLREVTEISNMIAAGILKLKDKANF
ncbi:four helix bundle protein [Patescibacteria group bacterium]|nr:four helix bundle protein [Patescibacteria group bacterium]MCL5010122.1 four helix bundle protein [Patescibacteria group bacterium]